MIPNKSKFPNIKKGFPVRGFAADGYRAILIQDPETEGVIEFLYALIVFATEDERTPVLVVTSQKSSLDKGITRELAQFAGFTTNVAAEGGVFLGLFDGDSHRNLGQSPENANLEHFERTALDLAKRELGLDHDFSVTKNAASDSASGGRWTPDDVGLETDINEQTIHVTEAELVDEIEAVIGRSGFAILRRADLDIWDATNFGEVTFIQMGAYENGTIVLEYVEDQPGSFLYRVEGEIEKDLVQSIFIRYLNADLSWTSELDWEKIDLSKEGKPWWKFW